MRSSETMRGQPVPSGNWSQTPIWGSGMPGAQKGNGRRNGKMKDARHKTAPPVGADVKRRK